MQKKKEKQIPHREGLDDLDGMNILVILISMGWLTVVNISRRRKERRCVFSHISERESHSQRDIMYVRRREKRKLMNKKRWQKSEVYNVRRVRKMS